MSPTTFTVVEADIDSLREASETGAVTSAVAGAFGTTAHSPV